MFQTPKYLQIDMIISNMFIIALLIVAGSLSLVIAISNDASRVENKWVALSCCSALLIWIFWTILSTKLDPDKRDSLFAIGRIFRMNIHAYYYVSRFTLLQLTFSLNCVNYT